MKVNTKSTRLDAFFKNVDLALFNNYLKSENGVTAKSSYPSDYSSNPPTYKLSDELSLVIYSTGLCKLNFNIQKDRSLYKWHVRILDASKKELLSFEYAPLVVESKHQNTTRNFKLERRFHQIDEKLIEKATYIQLRNEE
jgi:hypothetical protein